ncbi:MAG: hypothetical protein ACLUD0_06675 [Eubacterium ramulus]
MIRTSLEKLVEDKYPIIMHRPSEAVSFGASRFAGASRFDMAMALHIRKIQRRNRKTKK